MSNADLVPIKPAVLAWAIEEAGLRPRELAKALKVEAGVVDAWLSGASCPNTTLFRQAAQHLGRSPATLLLPEPPPATVPPSFRHPPGAPASRRITRDETQAVRTARRVHNLVRWLHERLDEEPTASLPSADPTQPPADAADALRRWLDWSVAIQTQARDPYAVLGQLRARLEERGVVVLHLKLGDQGCRGFSFHDKSRPLLAVNRRYIPAARIFTYGHELGHLAVGDGSLCLTSFHDGGIERWCEGVAGALFLPEKPLTDFVLRDLGLRHVSGLHEVRRIAQRFKVSLRATAYRLGELELAAPGLYRTVHLSTDLPSPRKEDDRFGERTGVRRFREYGPRLSASVLTAEARGILSRHDLVTYLDLPGAQLEEWKTLAAGDRRSE